MSNNNTEFQNQLSKLALESLIQSDILSIEILKRTLHNALSLVSDSSKRLYMFVQAQSAARVFAGRYEDTEKLYSAMKVNVHADIQALLDKVLRDSWEVLSLCDYHIKKESQ